MRRSVIALTIDFRLYFILPTLCFLLCLSRTGHAVGVAVGYGGVIVGVAVRVRVDVRVRVAV